MLNPENQLNTNSSKKSTMKKNIFLFLATTLLLFASCDRGDYYEINHDIFTLSFPTDAVVYNGETIIFNWEVPTGGCPGGVTYLWQQSNNGQTWTNAPGANTNRNYTTPPITTNTYFRRLTTDDCGDTFSTQTVRITIPVWATRNVATPGTFAANPQDAGMFFQWNRRQGWSATGDIIGWDSTPATGTEWERENDPCPTGWRVPTMQEVGTLIRNHSRWVENWNRTGVSGCLFGTAPNQIFLPAAGWRNYNNGALGNVGRNGCCMIWAQHGGANAGAGRVTLTIDGRCPTCGDIFQRANGFSVRCVAEN